MAASSSSKASSASNGTSICRRCRLASAALVSLPAIMRTRTKCEWARITTKTMTTKPTNCTKLPSPDQIQLTDNVASSTSRYQATINRR